jgi:hypothetical protein
MGFRQANTTGALGARFARGASCDWCASGELLRNLGETIGKDP